MKNNFCHHKCGDPLCNTCGTVLNLSDLAFHRPEDHLLYTDKVYSKASATACPIVFDLATTPETYQTQLLLSPLHDNNNENLCGEIFGCCNCSEVCNNQNICDQIRSNAHKHNCSCNCCNDCTVDETSVFNIINSYVRVLSFQQTTPCGLDASQVTLNGTAVDDLTCQGGLFEATLSQSLSAILSRACTDNSLPTKAFFLISQAGPWSYLAEFIIEGTVTTAGKTCCFRTIFTPVAGAEPTPIAGTTSNLSIPKLSIPCASGSALPRINFNFGGKINLLNPEIIATTTAGVTQLTLSTTAVAEPEVYAEVVKRTLFCLHAAEAVVPCNGQPVDKSCCQCCQCSQNQNAAINNETTCNCHAPEASITPDDDCLCERISENLQSSYCGNTLYL